IHEVAQRELVMMHAVDESEIDRAAEADAGVLGGEERIAGHLEEVTGRLAASHVAIEAEFGVDRDTGAARDRQRLASRRSHLQIGLRAPQRMQLREDLEIVPPLVPGATEIVGGRRE